MYNRARVLAEIEDCPKLLKEGKFAPNLAEYLTPDKAFPQDELEARICLLEEALVAWYRAKPDDFMGKFMHVLGFNWEDVRNSADDEITRESTAYRAILIERYGASDCEDRDNIWTAMRLTEKWLRQNAMANSDGGEPEFNFAVATLLDFFPRGVPAPVVIDLVRDRASSGQIIKALVFAFAFGILSAFSDNAFFPILCYGASAVNFLLASLLIFRRFWITPTRIRNVLALY